jgi:sporulation protein YlmC with PRC-barrel domain
MTRTALSRLDDWELEFGDQDVRGWPIQDASGSQLGTVQDMIVNTDTAFVDALLTDDGREIPVSEIQIGDRSEEIEVDKVARQETERLTDTVRRERVDITGDLDRSSDATTERSDER